MPPPSNKTSHTYTRADLLPKAVREYAEKHHIATRLRYFNLLLKSTLKG